MLGLPVISQHANYNSLIAATCKNTTKQQEQGAKMPELQTFVLIVSKSDWINFFLYSIRSYTHTFPKS